MNDQERRLRLARETWRTMCPSETDIRLGAERIAKTLRVRRYGGLTHNVRMLSVAVAAIAGVAYAGRGSWTETQLLRHLRWREAPVAAQSPAPPPQPRVSPESRVGADPNGLPRVEEGVASAAIAPKVAAKKKAKAEAAAGHASRRGAAGTVVGTRPESALELTREPSWSEVSSALSGPDSSQAEKLLLDLVDRARDPDTRAKANLGLAQLAASRGNCERARVLALGVAAVSGIEMKTIRRALELAVRCAR